MKLNIMSPTRGVEYTLENVLQKGFERRSLGVDEIKISHFVSSGCGDRDFLMEVKNLGCSDPQWTDSVSFRIDGIIPVHTTGGGAISFGFGCGNNDENLELGKIVVYLYKIPEQEYISEEGIPEVNSIEEQTIVNSIEEQTISLEEILNMEDWDNRKIKDYLTRIIESIIARRFFREIQNEKR